MTDYDMYNHPCNNTLYYCYDGIQKEVGYSFFL